MVLQDPRLERPQLAPARRKTCARDLGHPFVSWIGDDPEQLLDPLRPTERRSQNLPMQMRDSKGKSPRTLRMVCVGSLHRYQFTLMRRCGGLSRVCVCYRNNGASEPAEHIELSNGRQSAQHPSNQGPDGAPDRVAVTDERD
jgi:hypothetical protein